MTDMVSLSGKIHKAHPNKTVNNPTRGRKVAAPLCGQKSRSMYPNDQLTADAKVNCEKCLTIMNNEDGASKRRSYGSTRWFGPEN